MKKLNQFIVPLAVLSALIFTASCGGSGGPKVELTEKGKLITSITWKLDPSATLEGITNEIKDTSGITADIKLEGDVKKLANFAAETLVLAIDEDDQSKLSYSKTYGEGFLSTSLVGFWNFNADESAIVMREWDKEAGKEKEPVTYKIVELSAEKLVLQRDGDSAPNIYFPKK